MKNAWDALKVLIYKPESNEMPIVNADERLRAVEGDGGEQIVRISLGKRFEPIYLLL